VNIGARIYDSQAVDYGNHPSQAFIPDEDTPNFNKVVQVPTRILWEVKCVSQDGNKTGNKRFITNLRAALRPETEGK